MSSNANTSDKRYVSTIDKLAADGSSGMFDSGKPSEILQQLSLEKLEAAGTISPSELRALKKLRREPIDE